MKKKLIEIAKVMALAIVAIIAVAVVLFFTWLFLWEADAAGCVM